jgi:hypothetical protein
MNAVDLDAAPRTVPTVKPVIRPLAALHQSAASLSRRRSDVLVLSAYMLGALWVTVKLWVAPGQRTVGRSGTNDQIFFEWVLSHARWAVTNLENPLFTDRLNFPDGVNLMANTSVLGIGIPLVPVTAAFGPGVSYALMLTLGFALTSAAWYWLLSRHVVRSRFAAFVGGAFCGFAPGMVSQGIGHPNFVAQFLLPIIVWRVLKLREPGRAVRNGVILGLLVTYQVFINEEMLFFTAIACGVFLLTYAARNRAEVRPYVRPFLKGLGVAAALAFVLLAYPLWFQFFGPQHYHGIPYGASYYSPSIDAFVGYSTESLAGKSSAAARLSPNASEESSYFGWILLLLCGFVVWWQRRLPIVVPLAVTAAVFGLLSLGPELLVKSRPTGIPLPMALLSHLPIFNMVVPARLALPVIPIIGILVAIGIERVRNLLATNPPGTSVLRPLWYGLLAGAFIPIASTPIAAVPTPAVPEFIASGMWRDYVRPGRTLVTVPPSAYEYMTPMYWSAQCTQCFPLPRGYFVGPDYTGDTGRVGALPSGTASLLHEVAYSAIVPPIGPEERRQAEYDIARWRADVIVLAPQRHQYSLQVTMEGLLGPGRMVGGVMIWDVSHLAAP